MTFTKQIAALIASVSIALGVATFGPSLIGAGDEGLNAGGAPGQLAFDADPSNGDPDVPDAVSAAPSEVTETDAESAEILGAPDGAFDLQPVTPVEPPGTIARPSATPTPASPTSIKQPPTTGRNQTTPTTAGGPSATTASTTPSSSTTGSNAPQSSGTTTATTTNPSTSATPGTPTSSAAPTTRPPTTAAPTTAAPTTAPSGTLPDAPVSVGRLLFSEDFNSPTLDTNTWEPGWFASSGFSLPVNGNEDSCFHPKQVSQRDGSLVLQISAESDPNCKKKDGQQADYVGGLINSRDSFTFSYGYAEARIHLSASNGRLHNWPAFWHNGSNWPATGEVDILEGLSSGQPCTYYHFANSSGAHGQDGSCVNWADPGGWHTFAAHREPGLITFYFDGVEVFRTTQYVTGDPHYLILNYTTDESFGIVTDTEMLVDYVRVWEN